MAVTLVTEQLHQRPYLSESVAAEEMAATEAEAAEGAAVRTALTDRRNSGQALAVLAVKVAAEVLAETDAS